MMLFIKFITDMLTWFDSSSETINHKLIGWAHFGRTSIKKYDLLSLDLCQAIIEIHVNITRRPPSWKVDAVVKIRCNPLLQWITAYPLTEPAKLVSYKSL